MVLHTQYVEKYTIIVGYPPIWWKTCMISQTQRSTSWTSWRSMLIQSTTINNLVLVILEVIPLSQALVALKMYYWGSVRIIWSLDAYEKSATSSYIWVPYKPIKHHSQFCFNVSCLQIPLEFNNGCRYKRALLANNGLLLRGQSTFFVWLLSKKKGLWLFFQLLYIFIISSTSVAVVLML